MMNPPWTESYIPYSPTKCFKLLPQGILLAGAGWHKLFAKKNTLSAKSDERSNWGSRRGHWSGVWREHNSKRRGHCSSSTGTEILFPRTCSCSVLFSLTLVCHSLVCSAYMDYVLCSCTWAAFWFTWGFTPKQAPGLGPPDLCWLQKAPKPVLFISHAHTNPDASKGYYHHVLGNQISSSAAVAAYLAELINSVEPMSFMQVRSVMISQQATPGTPNAGWDLWG